MVWGGERRRERHLEAGHSLGEYGLAGFAERKKIEKSFPREEGGGAAANQNRSSPAAAMA